MSRAAALIFAILCYAIFFATFLYLIVFVGAFVFAGRTVNAGPEAAPVTAAVIDVALISLFGLQHSVMARQGFKRWWMQIVPPPVERSVYVLAASAALIVMFVFWRPIDMIVWNVTNPAFAGVLWAVFWIGWLGVLISTFLINHFELFGLQQAWLNLSGRKAEKKPELKQPLFYRWVAHPMMSSFFLAFWAAPEMTAGHLLLALGMSVYILVALRYEERDLTALFGDDYRRYRSGVGMLIPRFGRRAGGRIAPGA